MALQALLEQILASYAAARQEPFGPDHPARESFADLLDALNELDAVRRYRTLETRAFTGRGEWTRTPYVAFLDSRETTTPQKGISCALRFREDLSGVYLTMQISRAGRGNPPWAIREAARALMPELASRFEIDGSVDLHVSAIASAAKPETIAHKLYERGAVPDDAELARDLDVLLTAYERLLETRLQEKAVTSTVREPSTSFDRAAALETLIRDVAATGFHFEPWQIATYVTALRTKPFVILAGVTGTGKSKLPMLVAKLTGGAHDLIAVRPDWTDSGDVIGYRDLQQTFRPGLLLADAKRAADNPDRHFTCIVDEMNLARVEQYFAEVLSFLEHREPRAGGGFGSRALVQLPLEESEAAWRDVGLAPNFAIVGTVNMDESSHGFSRKVLDRAFTIELSDVDLTSWRGGSERTAETATWPADAWHPRAIALAAAELTEDEAARVDRTIATIVEVNRYLVDAQLQIGYRSRDEIVLFVLHASEAAASFRTTAGEAVDPLDLALQMKVLPRIAGGSHAVRRALLGLLGWSTRGTPFADEDEARPTLDGWSSGGRPASFAGARLPRTAARLCLMTDRLLADGFTSFWL